ncbi:disulfide bond formation protein DsbA [Advenella sp. S44]|uniref:DsbA family oxidoreductase n=1 Tax=Advenella sp. S44 TaxID=1982755 RepID=UPI000C2A52CB|nr:DsbA family oxidoreductase [Advenella sp. S44]PJX22227.1 disulfide bond formation protein DsbA [Advenella sp. S44]
MKKVSVEVWSDFVCPWCWIAKRRFDKAIASLLGKVDVSVTFKAYRLAKGAEPLEYRTALSQKFPSREAVERFMAIVGQNGVQEGLIYNFETMRFGDTTLAHALVKSIDSQALKLALTERIYKAATTDGCDIFDRDVLVSLAKEVGATDVAKDFINPTIISEIANDEVSANSIANGVPLFLFNGNAYVSGARDVAVFEKALLDTAVDSPEAIATSCSIDGCSI